MLKYFATGLICGLLLGCKLEITITLRNKKQADKSVGEIERKQNESI